MRLNLALIDSSHQRQRWRCLQQTNQPHKTYKQGIVWMGSNWWELYINSATRIAISLLVNQPSKQSLFAPVEIVMYSCILTEHWLIVLSSTRGGAVFNNQINHTKHTSKAQYGWVETSGNFMTISDGNFPMISDASSLGSTKNHPDDNFKHMRRAGRHWEKLIFVTFSR